MAQPPIVAVFGSRLIGSIHSYLLGFSIWNYTWMMNDDDQFQIEKYCRMISLYH